PEERALVQTGFKNAHIPSGILGIGLDAPPWHDAAPFRERYAPRGPVVLYLGQISEGKAVDELVADWVAYREGGGKGTLLLAGTQRSEERRVGKECRSRWARWQEEKKWW